MLSVSTAQSFLRHSGSPGFDLQHCTEMAVLVHSVLPTLGKVEVEGLPVYQHLHRECETTLGSMKLCSSLQNSVPFLQRKSPVLRNRGFVYSLKHPHIKIR